MARIKKFKMTEVCDRCPREVEHYVTQEEIIAQAKQKELGGAAEEHVALEVKSDGETLVKFEWLCDECREIIVKYISGVSKRPDKVSSRRAHKPKPAPAAPVVQAKEKPEAPPPQQTKPPAPPTQQKR